MLSITLSGHLAADAAIRNGAKGEFVTFKVIVNQKKGDETLTTGFDVTMPKTGVFEHLKKGTLVNIIGNFFTWESERDGKTFVNRTISAFMVELAGGKKKEGEGAEA